MYLYPEDNQREARNSKTDNIFDYEAFGIWQDQNLLDTESFDIGDDYNLESELTELIGWNVNYL